MEPDIKAACIQVLFSVAYHLKSSILSYSNDLLSIALKSLREGSQKVILIENRFSSRSGMIQILYSVICIRLVQMQ